MARIILVLFVISLFSADAERRVVVLGFDGADPVLAKRWIDSGDLPNLKKLAEQGSFHPLATSNPAQSPVAWASFATGKNPGKHNIYGFLKSGDKDYRPQLALARVEKRTLLGGLAGRVFLAFLLSTILFFGYYIAIRRRKNQKNILFGALSTLIIGGLVFWGLIHFIPKEIPWPVSLKSGPSLWTIAGNKGISTVVINAPIAFPAEEVPGGKLLCGFGVPDIAATNGLWFRYSSIFSRIESTETGGWKMPLIKKGKKWHGEIFGPRDIMADEKIKKWQKAIKTADIQKKRKLQNQLAELKNKPFLSIPIVLEGNDKLRLTMAGNTRELEKQQWSDWFTISFSVNPLFKIKGMVRAYVLETSPPELYITPVQFHPGYLPPNIQLSYPNSFAADLAQKELYPTLGWCEATNALKDEMIDEKVFWQDLQYTMKRREKLFFQEFDRKDQQLVMGFFYATDRAGHMYWRAIDPQHPRYNPRHKEKLLEVYRWMDRLVGKVAKKLDKDDILIVVSDHGFSSFRWGVHLNRWLQQNGYLSLKQDDNRRMQVVDLYRASSKSQIDWQKTRAYAIGLGKIYINLEGRESQGVVKKGREYQELCKEISDQLQQLQHNTTKVVHKIYHREEIYRGPYLTKAPDLIVGFERNYRISWQTTLGAIPPQVFEANQLKWSGDHCSVDPDLVPGIIFCNRQLNADNPRIRDIAPTILALFDITHKAMEGKVLLNRSK